MGSFMADRLRRSVASRIGPKPSCPYEKLTDEEIEQMEQRAEARGITVTEYLSLLSAMDAYADSGAAARPTPADVAAAVNHGRAYRWVNDEPDLYSIDDGIPYGR